MFSVFHAGIKLIPFWILSLQFTQFNVRKLEKKRYTPKQAFEKAMTYCAYQERSHYEVKQKLYDWGLYKSDVEEVIVKLIQEDFLNEERFAQAYVSGKFRIKKWGRNKIVQHLKQKQVSPYCIKVGLKEIDEEEYMEALRSVAEKKKETYNSGFKHHRRQKLARYLIGRGFESELVWEEVKGYYI